LDLVFDINYFSFTNPNLTNLPYLFEFNAYSSITRTLYFLIENWYMYPNENITGENTELKQAMLKLNTTFMLQRRCGPLCCNILYYYIIEPK